MNDNSVPSALFEAIKQLWDRPPLVDKSLFKDLPFIHLRTVCEELYGAAESKDGFNFALYNALRALGAPAWLPENKRSLALAPEDAAIRLDQAFLRKKASLTHLCPLDCADTDEFPTLNFGTATVRTYSSLELEELVDCSKLLRLHPLWEMDSERLAQFTWLVVKEDVPIDIVSEPGMRAFPDLYSSINLDFGVIEPHKQRLPPAVEIALFTLLLAPWENWGRYSCMDWHPFFTPLVYSMSDDIFVRQSTMPSSDTLSWEPHILRVDEENEEEIEIPTCMPLSDDVRDVRTWVNDESWKDVENANQAAIFGYPVVHFFVRAFMSSGIDEFLAHITVIEAGVGAMNDHFKRTGSKSQKNLRATERVARKLAALLQDKSTEIEFRRLYKARSEFIHGRAMSAIPSEDRLLARKLARKMAGALVKRAAKEPHLPREDFLQQLLDDYDSL